MSSKASTRANSVSSSRSVSRSSSFYGSSPLLPTPLRDHPDDAENSEVSTPRDGQRTLYPLRQGSTHGQQSHRQDPLHALEKAQAILQSAPGQVHGGVGSYFNGSRDATGSCIGPGNDSPRLRLSEDSPRCRLRFRQHLEEGLEKGSPGLRRSSLDLGPGGFTPRKSRSVSWAHYNPSSAPYPPPGAAPVQPSGQSLPTKGPVVPQLDLSKVGFSSLPPSPTVASTRRAPPRRSSMLCYSSTSPMQLPASEYSERSVDHLLQDLGLDSEALGDVDGRYHSTRPDTPSLFPDSKRLTFRGGRRDNLPPFKLTPREVAASKEMHAKCGQEDAKQQPQHCGADGPKEPRRFEGKSSLDLSYEMLKEVGSAESPRTFLPQMLKEMHSVESPRTYLPQMTPNSKALKPSSSLSLSGCWPPENLSSGDRRAPPRTISFTAVPPEDPQAKPFFSQEEILCPQAATEPCSSPPEQRGSQLKGSLLPKLGKPINPQDSRHSSASQNTAVSPTQQCPEPPPLLSPTLQQQVDGARGRQTVGAKQDNELPVADASSPTSVSARSPRGLQSDRSWGNFETVCNDECPTGSAFEQERVATEEGKLAAVERMRAQSEQVAQANPAAFDKEAGMAAEAKCREASELARQRLEALALAPGLSSSSKEGGHYGGSIMMIQANRHFYAAPSPQNRAVSERVIVPPSEDVFSPPKQCCSEDSTSPPKQWCLEGSIFTERYKENDAASIFDTDEVLDRQLDLDFLRVKTKARFRKMIAREDPSVGDAKGLDVVLQMLREELRNHVSSIRSLFAYFSCLSGHTTSISMLCLGLNEYRRFTQASGIVDKKSIGCTPADLDTIYIAASAKEGTLTDTSPKGGSSTGLLRFEFLEALIRIAVGAYVLPKSCPSVCTAVSRLFNEGMARSLRSIAAPDANAFRRERMYCKEMELLVLEHWDFLQAMFQVYKAKNRTHVFWIEHWIELLESAGILVPANFTGIDKLCAKLIFVTSQITVVDELKRRQRAVSLSLFDFVEALARLSEVLSPPAPDELAAWLSGRYQSAVSTQSAVSHPSAVSPRGSLGGVERGTSEPGAAAAPAHDASLAPNKARSNGGSNSGSSSGGSNGIRSKRSSSAIGNEGMPELAGVVVYFKELPTQPELLTARMARSGLGGELHQEAQKRPLVESFGPLIELLSAEMQKVWGGKNEAQAVIRMNKHAQSQLPFHG